MHEVAKVPTEADCQLRERIGSLMPEARDVWWSLRDGEDTDAIGTVLRTALETYAFPFLDARVFDEGLRDHWLAAPPLNNAGLALAILVRDLGPRELLAPMVERLRSQCPPTATLYLAAID